MIQKLAMIKTKSVRGNIYSVYYAGEIVYKSQPTHREYVALLLDNQFNPIYRFGRVDLIGKGDSRLHMVNHSYPWLATTDNVADLVFIPEQQDINTYIFNVRPGCSLIASGVSEKDAKKSLMIKRKRYMVSPSGINNAKIDDMKPWGRQK